MLFDLIRALLAAFVVVVAPGCFWAGLLRASEDRAERVVYSAALSMALVPVVALVPVYLLNTGVTLAVALISPPVVFISGLAAYLRFGPAKGSGEPVVPSPTSPLGAPALALLAVAFGLATAVMIGAIPGEPVPSAITGAVTGAVVPGPRILILICALVVAAGLLQLFLSRRAAPQGSQEPADETAGLPPVLSFPLSLRRLVLPAVAVLVLARGYLGPALHEWPFIRGVDHYSHAVMANRMMTEGRIEPYLIYPPGFHTTIAAISRLSGLEPLEIFPVLGPSFLLLPAFALYALARRLWGFEYGVAAALFSGLLLGGTYYYFNDAMYPNLVAAQYLTVLALASLIGMYASPSLRGGILLALLGSSVVLYHQVASLYLALLLALVGVFSLPYLLLRDRRRGVALLFSLAALGSLAVAYAWNTYDLGGAIAGLVGGSGSSTTGAVGMAVGTQVPYGIDVLLGTMVSQPVAWLGLLGALLLAGAGWRRGGLPVALAHTTLLLWALILFAGSRTSLTGFPQRFGRDLGVPLALLAALALVTVLRSLAPHRRRAVVFVTSAAVLLTVSLVGVQAVQSLRWASGPSIQVTITQEISAAGEWLEEHNTGGNIIVSPHANQVPSRMMLAMGHYSALQSFDLWQIESPRDLPPTGPGPLRDVIWVVTHPDDGRTQRILHERDVRYVVLYKDMPDRPTADFWRLFEAHPDLYRTAFENRDVLIVEPRG